MKNTKYHSSAAAGAASCTADDDRHVLARDCAEALRYLRTSPSFAMSLGARETMHTHFLAFLLETQEPELEAMRTAVREALGFPVAEGESSTCAVWREAKDLDLIIVPLKAEASENRFLLSHARAHVVEAKLKSIPTRKQLDGYDDVLKGGVKLTLHDMATGEEQDFFVGGSAKTRLARIRHVSKAILTPNGTSLGNDWEARSWADVAAAIQGAPSDGIPQAATLADYGQALAHVTAIAAQARAFFASAWQRKQTTLYDTMYQAPRVAAIAQARLTDLSSKIIYDAWLQQELQILPPHPRDYGSHVLYPRGNPGITFALDSSFQVNGKPVRLGVQIQDTEFRHYVELDKEDKALEQAVRNNARLFEDWLHGDIFGAKPRGTQASREGRETTLRAFNPGRFLFAWNRIEAHMTLAEVSEQLHRSLALAQRICALPAGA